MRILTYNLANSIVIENSIIYLIYVRETKGAITNGQFRDAGNTGITIQMTKKNTKN